jgi:hypothetical protein
MTTGTTELIPRLRRRFTLLDAMVLVAALAFGFVANRPILPILDEFSGHDRFPWLNSLTYAVAASAAPAEAVLVALACLRFVRPGRSVREWWTHPGSSALAAGHVGLVGNATLFGGVSAFISFDKYEHLLLIIVLFAPFLAAVGTLCGWLTLRGAGLWRRPDDWLDRLGLALGGFWFAATPLCLYALAR